MAPEPVDRPTCQRPQPAVENGAAVKLTNTRLFGIAAVLGGVAACAWPVAILLTRVRRLRCRVGPDGFEAEWELADRAPDRSG
jgi:hypothetical protein